MGARTCAVLVGPGARPDGWRAATARHADRLGLDLVWSEVEGTDAAVGTLVSLARTVAAVLLVSGELEVAQQLADAVAACPAPVVHAAPGERTVAAAPPVPAACTAEVYGRSRRSFRGALDRIDAELRHPGTVWSYGADPAQVGDLRLPSGSRGDRRVPVVVLLHGGFWLDPWQRDLMARLAVALSDAGWATWNVEYRRRGPTGGGWPASLVDACGAVGAVATLAATHAIDPGRVVLLGHSAGAQLALYAAARRFLDPEAPGEVPAVGVVGAVSLAGLLDLETAADLNDGAVATFLGRPEEHPDRYRLASPRQRVPFGIPHLVVHDPEDQLVPIAQSEAFVAAANAAGDPVAFHRAGGPHLDIVDPDGPALPLLLPWLERFRV